MQFMEGGYNYYPIFLVSREGAKKFKMQRKEKKAFAFFLYQNEQFMEGGYI
jgi:hypothetical protein